ncbi:MAG: class I SAM-dependent methyltransferase [Anaerolineae bacterium]|nr:class I SAM-dependent methyltransferase [Anaerolineae bacterium]
MEDYNILANKYAAWHQSVKGADPYKEELDFLTESANVILDVGCGAGEALAYLAPHSIFSVGTDISIEMMHIGKKIAVDNSIGNIAFVVADLDNQPFKKNTFDYIFSRYALHHSDLSISLPELERCLIPGGRLLVRDLVTNFPMFQRFGWWHALVVFFKIPKRIIKRGFKSLKLFLDLGLDPTWIQHQVENNLMSPRKFRQAYHNLLPGCWFSGKRRNVVHWVSPSSK